MVFDDWAGLGQLPVVGTCDYSPLLAALRVPGKRALTKDFGGRGP